MFFVLLLGMIIGAGIVFFALENTALVTLTLFTDHVTVPLAFVVLVALAAGIAITLLAMLPRFIQDALDERALRRQREIEAYVQTETVTERASN